MSNPSEVARMLRKPGCVPDTLRCLRWAALTVPQLAKVLRERYAASTVRQTVLTLRRLGLVAQAGARGRAKYWRAN